MTSPSPPSLAPCPRPLPSLLTHAAPCCPRYIPFAHQPCAAPRAYLVLPNVYVMNAAGKIMFAAVDIAVALLIVSILRRRGCPSATQVWLVAGWVYNPLVINVSTRGNADSVSVALILSTVLFLLRGQRHLSAIMFGLAVHLRIYPIFFALSCLLVLADRPPQGEKDAQLVWWRRLVNRRQVEFGVVSGGVFVSLGLLFYRIYGFTFLHETYLYHLSRRDNRHNFSVYFYDLYLGYGYEEEETCREACREACDTPRCVDSLMSLDIVPVYFPVSTRLTSPISHLSFLLTAGLVWFRHGSPGSWTGAIAFVPLIVVQVALSLKYVDLPAPPSLSVLSPSYPLSLSLPPFLPVTQSHAAILRLY